MDRSLARVLGALATALALTAACSSSGSGSNGVDAAQARVNKAQTAVTDAQTAADASAKAFCTQTKDYITAIDAYGKVFDKSASTVGDVKNAGQELDKPKSDVENAAQDVSSKQDALFSAQKELSDANSALLAAHLSSSAASASGTVPATAPPASVTTTTLVPTQTVDRVKKAESDFDKAASGVTDSTPLTQASAQLNSAGLSLELAWLRLLSDAKCLSDAQQTNAVTAVTNYTASLQGELKVAGLYTGELDGYYGPDTVAAVQTLQTNSGLPATGFVDRATGLALDTAVAAKQGAVTTQALTHTAAVQTTLKLAGYWTGAIDGQWTPELTAALQAFQTALGIPATGVVDAQTLVALEQTIADAKAAASTTTMPSTGAPGSTTTSSSS